MQKYKIMVEIPRHSEIKYEYNRATNAIEVDRILRDGFKYPATYGFLPQALDWDGDELDVLVYSDRDFLPGTFLNVRIVGAMRMIDSGETDTKLIGVHADDYLLDGINSLKDIPSKWLENVKYFFSHYKDWKGKDLTKVPGFEDEKWALAEINECIELMNKYGKLPKKEFVKKMQKEHPEKYTI
ncbi:inorganic pyrophosphatase [Mycoplasmopsis californica]|uniref:Inorganic pyrophosphatase n=1 Tax=Mycoplasmopsis equigenitalium TaxID=114883 RepID=A0ABY5J1T4_9BACT|nr:inorganic diphosphatase [Mycoplasmopsis equigenitalium]UUD37201.1 inorganic diphosphatase [Mycoplasmopsis equigenitalium]VEU69495.1 inorganic pyrophosphatase [Mycoplasmopsis californica]